MRHTIRRTIVIALSTLTFAAGLAVPAQASEYECFAVETPPPTVVRKTG